MEETNMKRISKILTLVLALCTLLSVSVFASGEPSGEAPAGVVPGTYVDGDNTLVIADDMTFVMETAGENMDGAAFLLTVTGTVSTDGKFAITGVFDGDMDLTSLATEEQLAGNLATVEATYAAAAGTSKGVVPGTYTDGTLTLIIADDMTFSMDKTGENMDGAAFVLTVTGTVTADGVFTITGLTDGAVELIDLATEDQLAADLASVEAVYAAATATPASGEAGVAPGTYTDGVNTLVIADDLTFVMNKTGENMDGAAFNLTVAGTVTPDGIFTITSLKDGDIELIEMATADQLAADLASVQAAFAG